MQSELLFKVGAKILPEVADEQVTFKGRSGHIGPE